MIAAPSTPSTTTPPTTTTRSKTYRPGAAVGPRHLRQQTEQAWYLTVGRHIGLFGTIAGRHRRRAGPAHLRRTPPPPVRAGRLDDVPLRIVSPDMPCRPRDAAPSTVCVTVPADPLARLQREGAGRSVITRLSNLTKNIVTPTRGAIMAP